MHQLPGADGQETYASFAPEPAQEAKLRILASPLEIGGEILHPFGGERLALRRLLEEEQGRGGLPVDLLGHSLGAAWR
jgi:hypothetical protein